MAVKAWEWVIHGRVQGVGFRYFVCEEARRLNLRGYVENLMTGEVKVVVKGDPTNLAEFKKLCTKGPPSSRVDGVTEKEIDIFNLISSFHIRH